GFRVLECLDEAALRRWSEAGLAAPRRLRQVRAAQWGKPGLYGGARPGVHERGGTGSPRPPMMWCRPVPPRWYGGVMNCDIAQTEVSRRTLVKGAAALGAATLLGQAFPGRSYAASPGPAAALTPLQHIVICAEENRSLDHYYGFASWIGSYGVPAGGNQPNGAGGPDGPPPL